MSGVPADAATWIASGGQKDVVKQPEEYILTSPIEIAIPTKETDEGNASVNILTDLLKTSTGIENNAFGRIALLLAGALQEPTILPDNPHITIAKRYPGEGNVADRVVADRANVRITPGEPVWAVDDLGKSKFKTSQEVEKGIQGRKIKEVTISIPNTGRMEIALNKLATDSYVSGLSQVKTIEEARIKIQELNEIAQAKNLGYRFEGTPTQESLSLSYSGISIVVDL